MAKAKTKTTEATGEVGTKVLVKRDVHPAGERVVYIQEPAKASSKNGSGRYSDQVKNRAIKLMLQGSTLEQVSKKTGVKHSTLGTWRKKATAVSPNDPLMVQAFNGTQERGDTDSQVASLVEELKLRLLQLQAEQGAIQMVLQRLQ
jgi:Transposase.